MTDDEREGAPDVVALEQEVRELRAALETFEADVEERTVKRNDLKSELKRYVRKRVRRGHAQGWGPYLVLLYGTAMTLGAFYWLRDAWSILAMLVVWLSTLGLYALMLVVGFGIEAVGAPGRIKNRIDEWRS